MKASFFKPDDNPEYNELGIRLEPETMDEELLLSMFCKCEPSFEFKFYGWESGGENRYPDGQRRMLRGVLGTIIRKP